MEFDFEIIGDEAIQDHLDGMIQEAPGVANEQLMETAEAIKTDIEDTAPVDTGEYQDSWSIIEVREDLVVLSSDAEHAPYVIFPNPVMRGSEKADKPSAGVLHDVRGIVRSHQDDMQASWSKRLRNWMGF